MKQLFELSIFLILIFSFISQAQPPEPILLHTEPGIWSDWEVSTQMGYTSQQGALYRFDQIDVLTADEHKIFLCDAAISIYETVSVQLSNSVYYPIQDISYRSFIDGMNQLWCLSLDNEHVLIDAINHPLQISGGLVEDLEQASHVQVVAADESSPSANFYWVADFNSFFNVSLEYSYLGVPNVINSLHDVSFGGDYGFWWNMDDPINFCWWPGLEGSVDTSYNDNHDNLLTSGMIDPSTKYMLFEDPSSTITYELSEWGIMLPYLVNIATITSVSQPDFINITETYYFGGFPGYYPCWVAYDDDGARIEWVDMDHDIDSIIPDYTVTKLRGAMSLDHVVELDDIATTYYVIWSEYNAESDETYLKAFPAIFYTDHAVGDTPVNLIKDFELHNPYPNPFNSRTKITYDLAAKAEVKLTVYNLLGKEVANLANGLLEAGQHSINWNAKDLSSGNYFIVLEANGNRQIKNIQLIR